MYVKFYMFSFFEHVKFHEHTDITSKYYLKNLRKQVAINKVSYYLTVMSFFRRLRVG